MTAAANTSPLILRLFRRPSEATTLYSRRQNHKASSSLLSSSLLGNLGYSARQQSQPLFRFNLDLAHHRRCRHTARCSFRSLLTRRQQQLQTPRLSTLTNVSISFSSKPPTLTRTDVGTPALLPAQRQQRPSTNSSSTSNESIMSESPPKKRKKDPVQLGEDETFKTCDVAASKDGSRGVGGVAPSTGGADADKSPDGADSDGGRDGGGGKQQPATQGGGGGGAVAKGKGKKKRNGKAKTKNFRRKQCEDEIGSRVPHPGSYASPEFRRSVLGLAVDEDAEIEAEGTASRLSQSAASNGNGEGGSGGEEGKATLVGEGAPPSSACDEEGKDKEQNAPKRKVVLLVAFLGQNYGGMQMNGGQRTIQAELERALHLGGYIAPSNFGFPHKYSWSNAARTDKGVHSCAQVCSVKILFDSSTERVLERVNELLPPDIRLLDVVRTSRKFCAHTQRDKVRYQYMLPSFLLHDPKLLRAAFEVHAGGAPPPRGDNAADVADDGSGRLWFESLLTESKRRALHDAFKSYRATPEQISRLRGALGEYVGTHSFHNYTRGKTFDDPSATRYIISFDVSEPVVSDLDGMEWIPTNVVGQSFLLNQIRKMVSMAVDVARGAATVDNLKESFARRRMKTDVAPAQGLFLDMSYFENYNERNGGNDPLDWSSPEGDAAAIGRWKQFKEGRVLPHIMEQERKEHNFLDHLYLHEYIFDRDRYLPLDDATKVCEDADATKHHVEENGGEAVKSGA